MKTIGVYGSLKKGFRLHNPYGLHDAEHLGDRTINGAMFRVGSGACYPVLFVGDRVGDFEPIDYTLEIYNVDDDTFGDLKRMEEGAGYETVAFEYEGIGEVNVFVGGERLERVKTQDYYIKEFTINIHNGVE